MTTVRTERRGRVLIVHMERPAKRNAVDAEMTAGLDDALNALEDDAQLWVGVLTGSEGVFSAGTDLLAGSGPPTERGGYYGVVGRHRSKPLVAAVEGLALGGGFELVLACDLVVAGSGATFGLPEVARGVVATSGALFRAPRALPLNVAKELLLTGDRLTAARAERLGLVNEVTEDGQALSSAVALAERICENAPVSVRATLTALDRLVAEADAAGWTATAEAAQTVLASADLREGTTAFAEKRRPVWQGR